MENFIVMDKIRLALLVTATITLTPAWAAPSPFFASAPRLSEQQLDALRGGFTTTSGLQISFGIERAVYINGDLITATALNVTAGLAESITTDAQQRVTSALAESPLQTNNTAPAANTTTMTATAEAAVATAPAAVSTVTTTSAAATPMLATTATTPTTTTTATVPTSLGTLVSGNSAASSSSVSMQQSAGGLVVVQNGTGNLYQAGTLDPNALGTIIQNTLNDQKIQNVTLINASVNSAEVLRAQMMRESITSAVTGSLRR